MYEDVIQMKLYIYIIKASSVLGIDLTNKTFTSKSVV